MDNIVTPPLSPALLPTGTATEDSGRLTGLLPDNLTLRLGDRLLLETLLNTSAAASSSPAPNTVFAVGLRHNGQSFPLSLRLETPLPLDTSRPHELEAKVTALPAGDSGLNVRLISVDRHSLTAFRRQASPEAGRAESPALIVHRTGASSAAPEIFPLPLKPVLQQLFSELKLPPALAAQINQRLPAAELQVEFLRITPQPVLSPEILAPLRQTLQQLAAAPQPLEQHVNQLLGQINDLAGQTFVALPRPAPLGDTPLLFSPLGTLSVQPPLRLAPEDALLLQITAVLPSEPALPPFSETPPMPLLEKFAAALLRLPGLEAPRPEIILENLSRSFRTSESQASGLFRMVQPLLEPAAPLPRAETPVLNSLLAAIAEKFPAAGPRLLANLHNFFQAAQKQDSRLWLGRDLTQSLENQGPAGHRVLAAAADFITAQTRETAGWRQVDIPFFDGSQFNQIRLAVKKKNQDQENQQPSRPTSAGTRFLLESEFSRLGRFQFDGFSRLEDRRFDLIIRTSRFLPEDFCSRVINLFKTSLYDVKYSGSIKINREEAFLKIPDAAAAPDLIRSGVYI